MVNGRCVWKKDGGAHYLYYAQRMKGEDTRWHWWMSDRADMQEEKPTGYAKVASEAVEPHKIHGVWQKQSGGGWADLAGARVEQVESQLEAEVRAKEEEQAMKEAEEQIQKNVEAERTRKEVEEQAKKEAEEQAKQEAEEQARKEAEEQARKDVEELARKEAEEQARKEVEEQARKEVEEQARKEAEEQARKEVEEQARKEVEEQARKEVEEQSRKEVEEQARKEVEEQARKEVEEQARKEVEEQARKEVEEQAKQGAEQQQQQQQDQQHPQQYQHQQRARYIWLEGLEKGELGCGLMGVFELIEGKAINGRGVWQKVGMEDFLFYSNRKEWWISNRERMEAGVGKGWMFVVSTALTPDLIAGTWQIGDGDVFHRAPEMKVHLCGKHEAHKAAARARACEEALVAELEEHWGEVVGMLGSADREHLEKEAEGATTEEKLGMVYQVKEILAQQATSGLGTAAQPRRRSTPSRRADAEEDT
jgi:chemotaxis protein histidine kinase CheA